MKAELKELLSRFKGAEPEQVVTLAAAGSNRVYYRFIMPGGESLVGVEGTNRDENRTLVTHHCLE